MKKNMLTSTLILTVGGVMAKVFSAIYRIFLTRILGGEGIGIYQLIFPFYSLCVVLATAGLPMAISKVIAKNPQAEKSVIKKSFSFTILISLVLTFVLLISSKGLATIQNNKEIFICYIILAPTIILVSASSVLRGYFQGKQNFTPSAISNILEQFIKLIFGLLLTLILIRYSLILAIVGAIVSIVISEIFSFLVLLFCLKKNKFNEGGNISIKQLAKDVIPITLTNILLPLSGFIDSVLIVNLLAFNFDCKLATFLYGLESGAVSSLIGLPTIFSFSIACVIMPNLINVGSNQKQKEKITTALKIILLVTLPCVVCFIFVPNTIIHFLYGTRLNVGLINGNIISSRMLAISSLGVIFLSINQLYSTCLQAVEERSATIRNLLIAIIIKLIISVLIIPLKVINIYGLALANTFCYLTAMLLNHIDIKKYFDIKLDFEFLNKLAISNLIMMIVLIACLSKQSSLTNIVLSFVVAFLVYVCMLILTNILKSEKTKIKMSNKMIKL